MECIESSLFAMCHSIALHYASAVCQSCFSISHQHLKSANCPRWTTSGMEVIHVAFLKFRSLLSPILIDIFFLYHSTLVKNPIFSMLKWKQRWKRHKNSSQIKSYQVSQTSLNILRFAIKAVLDYLVLVVLHEPWEKGRCWTPTRKIWHAWVRNRKSKETQ